MLTLHSFLRSVVLFVKSLTVKVTKQMYRSSSVVMAGMMVVAIIAFSANGFGGGGRNALAAPMTEESDAIDMAEEENEGSGLVTEAKVQFGHLNTDSEGQHLAGALLEADVREKQRKQAAAQTQIETLQKQILKERQEEEARKKRRRKSAGQPEGLNIRMKITRYPAHCPGGGGNLRPKGKILVADVIINRVLSGKFPDSVKAVVYQPSQFQPVSNGTINTVKVTAETIECVDRALAGEDYSNGALYFMNRRASGSAASWFDRRLTYLFAHDGHEFFR